MFVHLSAGTLEELTHPAVGEITDRRRTSEEEKPDIPVNFNDPILLPEKTLRCRLFGREGSRLSLPVNVTEIMWSCRFIFQAGSAPTALHSQLTRGRAASRCLPTSAARPVGLHFFQSTSSHTLTCGPGALVLTWDGIACPAEAPISPVVKDGVKLQPVKYSADVSHLESWV